MKKGLKTQVVLILLALLSWENAGAVAYQISAVVTSKVFGTAPDSLVFTEERFWGEILYFGSHEVECFSDQCFYGSPVAYVHLTDGHHTISFSTGVPSLGGGGLGGPSWGTGHLCSLDVGDCASAEDADVYSSIGGPFFLFAPPPSYPALVSLPDSLDVSKFTGGGFVGEFFYPDRRSGWPTGAYSVSGTIDRMSVPEPGTLALLGLGLAGLGLSRRRKAN